VARDISSHFIIFYIFNIKKAYDLSYSDGFGYRWVDFRKLNPPISTTTRNMLVTCGFYCGKISAGTLEDFPAELVDRRNVHAETEVAGKSLVNFDISCGFM
jgi:hypothetical protein